MKKTLKIATIIFGLGTLLIMAFGALAQDKGELSVAEEGAATIMVDYAESLKAPVVANDKNIVPFACGLSNCAYLPLTNRSPEVTNVTVGYRSNCSADYSYHEFTTNSVNFGRQREVGFFAIATGYSGSVSETYFTYDLGGGEQSTFRRTRTITTDPFTMDAGIVNYGQVGTSGCRDYFPTGYITANFVIDGELVEQRTIQLD